MILKKNLKHKLKYQIFTNENCKRPCNKNIEKIDRTKVHMIKVKLRKNVK